MFAALNSVRCLGAKVVLLVLFAWFMQVNQTPLRRGSLSRTGVCGCEGDNFLS